MSGKRREGRGAEKVARIPVMVEAAPPLRKPAWIRARHHGSAEVARIKGVLREHGLHTVCEEAACPNLGECFGHGTATFLILGDTCTRRCPFCDVAHGRPQPPDPEEPVRLAETVAAMGLTYAVITSVNRDDLRDGGAGHFADCVEAIRTATPTTQIELLVPDFRGRVETALDRLATSPPDVFNHNIETVPRLYPTVRPGADYAGSLALLRDFGTRFPAVPTKSGLMVGLGEEIEEVVAAMGDLRDHGCSMVTIGQYLQPSIHHLPVARYVEPEEFDRLGEIARDLGFVSVASGPLVRSSWHADLQARALLPERERPA